MRTAGTHVLVTGASRGIGVAIAREFADRGARVTVAARSETPLQEVARSIGGHAVVVDLEKGCDGLVARVEDEAGPVDVLVNNAAVAVVGRLAEQTSDDLRASFALNALAPLELCRQVVPGMLERGSGAIVNVSSLAGVTAFPTLTTYGATKAALVHFSAALQRELRTTPVNVTIVQLGEVAGTEMMEQARRSPTIAAVSARLGRLRALPSISPELVARKIAEGVEHGRRNVVVPARAAAFHVIREFPSRLNDVLLRGIE